MSNRPFTIVVAAAVVALEGLTALALGGWVVYETLLGAAGDVMSSLVLAVFGLAVGAGLLWVAWGIVQLMRWSRGPAVVTQIFAVPVAITLMQAGQLGWGLPLIVGAGVILVTLLAPPSTQALMSDV
ncbi:hypothetical protein [Herbidospora mongoliensis]|uniref:hypothetical protein n=1 Tax=Herbidospora mongoliensis TaxID=688067 RepID=UPI000AC40AC8|nr:hypothetical protein [Herbidospora mongoliensis]